MNNDNNDNNDKNILTETLVDRYTTLIKHDIIGGSDLNKNHPRGGFLPIVLCKKKKQDDDTLNNREFLNKKTNSMSIKDILSNRRNNK